MRRIFIYPRGGEKLAVVMIVVAVCLYHLPAFVRLGIFARAPFGGANIYESFILFAARKNIDDIMRADRFLAAKITYIFIKRRWQFYSAAIVARVSCRFDVKAASRAHTDGRSVSGNTRP